MVEFGSYDTVWPAKPKIFTSRLFFTEKMCWPLFCTKKYKQREQ